jgi:hypothetical protein
MGLFQRWLDTRLGKLKKKEKEKRKSLQPSPYQAWIWALRHHHCTSPTPPLRAAAAREPRRSR